MTITTEQGAFDDAATVAMGAAFDMARRSLPQPCHNESVRDIIAKHIVEAAKTGERDPAKLCARALGAVDIGEISMLVVRVVRDAALQVDA
jgi:hypothetical protein